MIEESHVEQFSSPSPTPTIHRCLGEVALVDEGTGVVPGVGGPVVTVDVILLGRAVEEHTPPEIVVEPQFALGHHRRGGTTHPGGGEGEVPISFFSGEEERMNIPTDTQLRGIANYFCQ